MFVKNINSFNEEKVAAGKGTTKQVLIGSEQGPNFAMRRFTISPGGNMPLHTNTVEHEQLVLNGSAKVIIADQEYIVKKDDVVFIPANIPHSYETIGNEPFQFLCLIPNKEDIIKIVENS